MTALPTARPTGTGTAAGRRSWRRAAVLLPLAVALTLWIIAIPEISLYRLDDYGLLHEFPMGWYAALAICLAGGALSASTSAPTWVTGAYVVGAALVLYATLPLVAEQPHYSWVYKHIGVVRYIDAAGQTDPNVDIYNRWPGFFALGAAFSRLSGVEDPARYAAWTELFFTLVNLGLLWGIVRTVTRSVAVAGGSCVLLLAVNWVGQTYFAPQALGFTLDLAVLWVVVTQMLTGRARLAHRLLRTIARVVRRPQDHDVPGGVGWWRVATAVGVVLLLDAAMVVSHQLSPYMLTIQLLGLAVLGLLRPPWVVAAVLALAVIYLVPNLDYIRSNFGLFSSFDPFNNVQHSKLYDISPMAGKQFSARAGQLLSATMWLLATFSLLTLLRRGAGVRAGVLAVLAFSPFAMVLGQNYGGEAALRVILFSAPWCAALIAWAFITTRRRGLAILGTTAATLVCAAMFVPAYYGQEELNSMPATEVQASNELYARGEAGYVVMLSGPNFPIRYGSRYRLFRGPQSDDDPNLLRTNRFRNKRLGGPDDIGDMISIIQSYSDRGGYVVFSTTQEIYARVFNLTPPGELRRLEAAVRRSSRFSLWLENADTRIYAITADDLHPRR